MQWEEKRMRGEKKITEKLKEETFNCIGFNIETDWLVETTIAWKFVWLDDNWSREN